MMRSIVRVIKHACGRAAHSCSLRARRGKTLDERFRPDDFARTRELGPFDGSIGIDTLYTGHRLEGWSRDRTETFLGMRPTASADRGEYAAPGQ